MPTRIPTSQSTVAAIVHQHDLAQQFRRTVIHDAVKSSQKNCPRLVAIGNHHGNLGQLETFAVTGIEDMATVA